MATVKAPPHRREPRIPEERVPGDGTLVGIVRSSNHTGLDEQAGDGEHTAVGGKPDRHDPSERSHRSGSSPGRELSGAHSHEHESHDSCYEFGDGDQPQCDDDTGRPRPTPALDLATDGVEQRRATKRPVRAHRCARRTHARGDHGRDDSTPIEPRHRASLHEISGGRRRSMHRRGVGGWSVVAHPHRPIGCPGSGAIASWNVTASRNPTSHEQAR